MVRPQRQGKVQLVPLVLRVHYMVHGASSGAVAAGCSHAFAVKSQTEDRGKAAKNNGEVLYTHTHISNNLLLLLVSIKNRISLGSQIQLCQMAPAWQRKAS